MGRGVICSIKFPPSPPHLQLVFYLEPLPLANLLTFPGFSTVITATLYPVASSRHGSGFCPLLWSNFLRLSLCLSLSMCVSQYCVPAWRLHITVALPWTSSPRALSIHPLDTWVLLTVGAPPQLAPSPGEVPAPQCTHHPPASLPPLGLRPELLLFLTLTRARTSTAQRSGCTSPSDTCAQCGSSSSRSASHSTAWAVPAAAGTHAPSP